MAKAFAARVGDEPTLGRRDYSLPQRVIATYASGESDTARAPRTSDAPIRLRGQRQPITGGFFAVSR